MIVSTAEFASWFEEQVSKSAQLRVSSPFVTAAGVEILRKGLQIGRLKVDLIIAINELAILLGSLDLQSIADLQEEFPSQFRVFSVRALHAKVIVADLRVASVGSANLTRKGHGANIELGVVIQNRTEVKQLAAQLDRWRGDRRPLCAGELRTHATLVLDRLRHLKELLTYELEGVVAFPHFSETYPELMAKIVAGIPPRKGMPLEEFDMTLASQRGNKEDASTLVRRRLFLTRLGLIRVVADKVYRGPMAKHADDKRVLSRIMRREFPQVDEFLKLVNRGNWTNQKLKPKIASKGSESLQQQWPAIKRWCAHLGLIRVTKGGLKNVRSFEVPARTTHLTKDS